MKPLLTDQDVSWYNSLFSDSRLDEDYHALLISAELTSISERIT